VLDPVALKDFDGPIIPFDREVDRQLALRNAKHGTEAGLQPEMVSSGIELS
jgi:hypothetical protein